MSDLVARFTSRKFLLAIGAAITALAAHQYSAAAAIVLGYLTTEGILDHKNLARAQAVESSAAAKAVTVDSIVKQVVAEVQAQAPPARRARTTRSTGSTK